jgi:predicted ATPase
MIEHIHIEGFRSFKELDLDLGPLNVLIGPNASGKSNFLDFFALLKEGAEGKLQDGIVRRGGIDELLWKGGADRVEVVARLSGLPAHLPLSAFFKSTERYAYEFALREWRFAGGMVTGERLRTADGSWTQELAHARGAELGVSDPAEPVPRALRALLRGTVRYPGFLAGHDAPLRRPALARATTLLDPDGGNLPAVLHYLSQKREYQSVYKDICEAVSAAYPDFEGMTFPSEGGDGRIVLRWKDKSLPKDMSAFFLSDGTLKFLCLVTVLLAPDPPALICIDLPEEGLHPSLMPIIADLLHDAATRTQLVVATHSVQLVDRLQPEEVVIVEKEEGGTGMWPPGDRTELQEWLKDFTLGELWLTGEIGGRP